MNAETKSHLDNLHSKDANSRYESFQYVIKLTQQPVDWAYDVWNDLLLMLIQGDNHQRSIAAQLLSNLAKSDPENRMLQDVDKIFIVTRDEKFVTARHSLLALWKIAIVNQPLQKKIMDYLTHRYTTSAGEKNCTLIRYDIMEVMRKIYNNTNDATITATALALIETEEDPKYRKKYTTVWKDLIPKENKKKF